MTVFAERVKNLRSKRGKTQDEIGKALGKSREAVSKYEKGEREPDLDALASFARYFNVSTDYILGITDNSNILADRLEKYLSSGMYIFEKYLQDESFIPYLKLAAKIKDNNLELGKIEKFVDNLVK